MSPWPSWCFWYFVPYLCVLSHSQSGLAIVLDTADSLARILGEGIDLGERIFSICWWLVDVCSIAKCGIDAVARPAKGHSDRTKYWYRSPKTKHSFCFSEFRKFSVVCGIGHGARIWLYDRDMYPLDAFYLLDSAIVISGLLWLFVFGILTCKISVISRLYPGVKDP